MSFTPQQIEAMKKKIQDLQALQGTGLMGKVFAAFAGRTTFFAFSIFVMGTILAWFHRLTADYVALMGVIQTLVCFRAVSDDYHDRKTQEQANAQANATAAQATTVNVNVTDSDDKKAA
jgi:hypothetical protein